MATLPSSAALRGRIIRPLQALIQYLVNNKVLIFKVTGAVIAVLIAHAESTDEPEATAPAETEE